MREQDLCPQELGGPPEKCSEISNSAFLSPDHQVQWASHGVTAIQQDEILGWEWGEREILAAAAWSINLLYHHRMALLSPLNVPPVYAVPIASQLATKSIFTPSFHVPSTSNIVPLGYKWKEDQDMK